MNGLATPIDTDSASARRAVSAAPAVLDPVALERLRELDPTGRNHVVERVLRAFEGSLQRLLDQAARAHADGDHHGVRHVAHTLKSSSASVGAIELSQRCCDIENRLRVQPGPGLDASMQGLHVEGRRVLAAVQALLESR